MPGGTIGQSPRGSAASGNVVRIVRPDLTIWMAFSNWSAFVSPVKAYRRRLCRTHNSASRC